MQRALSQWVKDGHLAGDEHAAARAVLHAAFENLDEAERGRLAGDVTPYSAAMVLRSAHEILRAWAPTVADVDDDPLSAFLDDGDG